MGLCLQLIMWSGKKGGGGGEEATCPECHHSLAEPWSACSRRHRWPRQAHRPLSAPPALPCRFSLEVKAVFLRCPAPWKLRGFTHLGYVSEASLGQVAPPLHQQTQPSSLLKFFDQDCRPEGTNHWVLNFNSVLSMGVEATFSKVLSHQTPHPLESGDHLSAFTFES